MKKDNLLSTVCLVGILALCFPLVARADSSNFAKGVTNRPTQTLYK